VVVLTAKSESVTVTVPMPVVAIAPPLLAALLFANKTPSASTLPFAPLRSRR